MINPLPPCDRCGNPADSAIYSELALSHGWGGVPHCRRCIAEIQLAKAYERRDAIPELEMMVAQYGGPLLMGEFICGRKNGQVIEELPHFEPCLLPKGHAGPHSPVRQR